MDSNHRRHTPADLQSAPFGHSGTPPNNSVIYSKELLLPKKELQKYGVFLSWQNSLEKNLMFFFERILYSLKVPF